MGHSSTEPTRAAVFEPVRSPSRPLLIEEGEAWRWLGGQAAAGKGTTRPGGPPKRNRWPQAERVDVVVIGAGQAGLSVAYHLARRGVRFIVLEANDRIGDVWRRRWDSLRLFTPAKFDGLPGLAFPASGNSFPTKDQMADYLESYAAHFDLPVKTGVRVTRLSKSDGSYLIETQDRSLRSAHVVVAMANYQRPRIPSFASQLSSDIVQIHSSEYKNPDQLREGGVLIVGAGNSGSEIALELARSRSVWMSGRDTGEVPFRVAGFWGRLILARLVLRVLFHRILSVATPLGRRARPKITGQGGPLIRVKARDLRAAGIERVPRTTAARGGQPLLEDGRALGVSNVVWCTGYTPGFSWIDLPVFDEAGEPRHDSGIVPGESGLYWVGLHFLHALSSVMIHGVGRDAARVARVIDSRLQRSRVGEATAAARARGETAGPRAEAL